MLRGAGIDPEVVISGDDESTGQELDTAALVQHLADRKAAAVAARRPDALILGCDTMLDLDGVAYGKPANAQEVTQMWKTLSGREASLLTGHCLIDADGRRACGVARTAIRFGTPTEAEIAAYATCDEALTMAGGFSIDGRAAPFVDGIDGDPNNVIGLCLPLFRTLLADLGYAITDLWTRTLA